MVRLNISFFSAGGVPPPKGGSIYKTSYKKLATLIPPWQNHSMLGRDALGSTLVYAAIESIKFDVIILVISDSRSKFLEKLLVFGEMEKSTAYLKRSNQLRS